MSTRFLCLLLVCFSISVFAKPRKRARHVAEARPIKLTKVGSCALPTDGDKPAKTVMVVKQWHLSPKTITKGFKEKYPQERNQQAIYSALADAVKKKSVQLIVAEGCEGQIDADFKPNFNGWDFASLRAVAQTKGYDKILSHVPLKLEARFGDDLRTVTNAVRLTRTPNPVASVQVTFAPARNITWKVSGNTVLFDAPVPKGTQITVTYQY